ncbi:MAG: heavy-metal-associated domain-containing protein [Bacteroidales bacterium]
MKKINRISGWMLTLMVIAVFSSASFGQQKKTDTIAIKTSAVCGMCKERIEGCFAFEKGVKSATLDVETKVATIIFNPAKTTPVVLRQTLSKLGYDADTVQANPVAYAKLPACCKKDAPKH